MKVKPCRDANAIMIVAFALEFQRDFSVGELQLLLSLHKGDEDALPQVQKHESFSIQLNPGSHQQITGPTDLGGVTFSLMLPNGTHEWSFMARQNTVVIQCTNYTRWSEISNKAFDFINRFVPKISESNMVNAIGIEYRDEFLIRDSSAGWMQELFKTDTVYMPSYLFDVNKLWHSHSGCITDVTIDEEEAAEQMLTKINIDYIHEQGVGHKVVSTTHHRISFGDMKSNFVDFSQGEMASYVEAMHDKNKSVIRNLLSDDMLKAINLEGSNAY